MKMVKKSLAPDNRQNGKKLIIGLGTGRCGTTSLSHLLNIQTDATVSHEEFHSSKQPFRLTYQYHHTNLLRALDILSKRTTTIVGDVGFYWISYVMSLLGSMPETKFICLKRDKEEVVESFWSRRSGRPIGDPNTRKIPVTIKGVELTGQYIPLRQNMGPRLDQLKAGTAQVWENYYKKANKIEKAFPNNFRIFWLDTLNTEKGVRQILNFAGIPEDNHITESGIWLNRRGV